MTNFDESMSVRVAKTSDYKPNATDVVSRPLYSHQALHSVQTHTPKVGGFTGQFYRINTTKESPIALYIK